MAHHHGPHCPPTTSQFLGTRIHLDTKEAATLTLGVSLIKGLLGACMTGRLDGFGQSMNVAADISEQAIVHPNVYHPPKRFP